MLGFEIKVRIGVLPEGKDMGKWWKMDAVAATLYVGTWWWLQKTTISIHFRLQRILPTSLMLTSFSSLSSNITSILACLMGFCNKQLGKCFRKDTTKNGGFRCLFTIHVYHPSAQVTGSIQSDVSHDLGQGASLFICSNSFSSCRFQPNWKNISQNGNLPQMFGENKNIWNHHLVVDSFTHLEIKNSNTDYI